MRQRSARGHRGGGGGQRVVHVVAPRQAKGHRHRTCGALQCESSDETLCAHVQMQITGFEVSVVESEAHHARARHAAPQRGIVIVGINDRDARRVQAGHHLTFSARHTLEAAEAFEMFCAGIGDHTDAGSGDLHQRGHFAGVIGADLDDGAQLRIAQPQQGERHAQMIVEVAARRQTLAALRQNRAQHFFGGGLAIAAGDTNHRTAKRSSPGAARPAQCLRHIGHHNLRQRRSNALADDCPGRTGLRSRSHILMAVGMLAGKCRKQIARRDLAGIDHDFVKCGIAERSVSAFETTVALGGEVLERALHAALRSFKAALTWAKSLNARRSVPTS